MWIDRTARARAEGRLVAGAGFARAAVAPADRFEAWCAAMRPSHGIRPIEMSGRAPHVQWADWPLGDLVCSELAFSPIAYRRAAPQGGAAERVLLRLYCEGHGSGMFGEAPFRTGPGEIHLFDQAPPSHGVTSDRHHLLSVFVPYVAIDYEPGRHPAHLSIPADSAAGRMLRAAIEALFADLPHVSQPEAPALANGLAGLVRGLLLSGAPSAASSSAFDGARRRAMRRYLDDRLADPELGVASLCAAFNASRATVYRDFAEQGGVERFIVRRRLERAFQDLASRPPERGQVRRVAERWAFACPYHFSRAFRRRFGLWPSEAFEATRGDAVGAPDATL